MFPNYVQSEYLDLKNLKTILKTLDGWKQDLKSLKENTSEIHLFKVIKFLDKEVHTQASEVAKFTTNKQVVTFEPSETLLSYKTVFPSLGTLTIKPVSNPTTLNPEKIRQSQVPVRGPRETLSILRAFKANILAEHVKLSSGCFISADKLLLKPQFEFVLHICNLYGSDSKAITSDFYPECLSKFDNNQALVSSGENYIHAINILDMKPGRRITIGGTYCKGLSSINGKIWLKTDDKTLVSIDTDGNELDKITTTIDPRYICVHQSGDIFFTSESNKIFVIWSDRKTRLFYRPPFKHPALVNPSGLTVAGDDVYVAGMDSNNIYKISIDGQNHTIVLIESDGIKEPSGLSYNSEIKELMVLNNHGLSIDFFKIKPSG